MRDKEEAVFSFNPLHTNFWNFAQTIRYRRSLYSKFCRQRKRERNRMGGATRAFNILLLSPTKVEVFGFWGEYVRKAET